MCEHDDDYQDEDEDYEPYTAPEDMDEEYVGKMSVSSLLNLIHELVKERDKADREATSLKEKIELGQLLPLCLPFLARCSVTIDGRADELWNKEMRHTLAESLSMPKPIPPFHLGAADTLELTGPIFTLAAGLRPYIKSNPEVFQGSAFHVKQIAFHMPIITGGEKHVLTLEDNLREDSDVAGDKETG